MNNFNEKRYYNKRLKRIRSRYIKESKSMLKNIDIDKSMFSKSLIKEYKQKWGVIAPNVNEIYFKMCCTLREEIDLNYVPFDFYFFPMFYHLKDNRYAKFFSNKSLYELYLPDLKGIIPDTIFKKINNDYYDEDFILINDITSYIAKLEIEEIVVKPSLDGSGGKGVHLFKKSHLDGKYYSKDIQLISYLNTGKDFIVQEKACQSAFMKTINPSSINTFRVATYQSVADNKVHIVQMALKNGLEGSFVDNQKNGGFMVNVNNDGTFENFGLGLKSDKVPFKYGGKKCPNYNKIVSLAKDITYQNFVYRQLFFDIYIDENENAKIIEINHSPSPDLQTICGPAFGQYTDEVIDYCMGKKLKPKITFY